jgi:voltage-gated sodium channel
MKRLRAFVESDLFRRTVIAAILLNALHIGLETDPEIVRVWGGVLSRVDRAVLVLFSVEMFLRLLAAAPFSSFFHDYWNWFDCAIIGAGFLPGSEFLTVFRLLRILRIMRTVRVMPGLKKVANAVLDSIPAAANMLVILLLLFYIYGTAGTLLYGPILPEKFGSLGLTLLTLFQIITLEGWSTLMGQVLIKAPHAWIYFISFILLGSYFALSSAIGIIVGHLMSDDDSGELAQVREALARIEKRLDQLSR